MTHLPTLFSGLLLVLASSGPGLAEELRFETIVQGVAPASSLPPAHTLVRSPDEFRDSGSDRLLPLVEIDFLREALLIVRMPGQPASPCSIDVASIDAVPPEASNGTGPAVSLTTKLTVRVRVALSSEAPRSGVPFCLVRIRRPAGGLVARFETEVEFESVRRSLGTIARAREITVSKTGEVLLEERAQGSSSHTRGRVSAERVRELRQTLATVAFTQLPASLPAKVASPLGAPVVSYTVLAGGGERRVSGVAPVLERSIKLQLRPLDVLLAAIRNEVLAKAEKAEAKAAKETPGLEGSLRD